MITDDFLMPAESTISDGMVNGFQYPNLFRHEIKNCQNTFYSLDLLTEQGFTPVDSLSDEVIEIFKTDELYLNLNLIKNVYVKDLGLYKIMVVVSISTHIQDVYNHNYHIMSKVLLDKHDNLLKKLEAGLPSITFYRKDTISAKRSYIILDGYYTFFDHYYSFTDLEDFDYHNTKYSFTFRDFNHNIIATSVHANSSIENITLKNSTFYMRGKPYDPNVLFEIEGLSKGNNFIDYLRCRVLMTQDKIDLLAMAVI